jgi:putative glycosyltransferase (TIGR04348 family)
MPDQTLSIAIVSPVPEDSTRGNGVTARRWHRILSELGHRARVCTGGDLPADVDLLIALHATKSADAVQSFRARPRREGIVVLALTGTDLYCDLPANPRARDTVRTADRIVVLQEKALERLPDEIRARARVIHQSVPAPEGPAPPRDPGFSMCVLAHLREVKDPLCAARAAALLPGDTTVRVTLAGAADDPEWERAALSEQASNPRFSWVGELSGPQAAQLLRRSAALVVSSRAEGGANVISEAVVAGVPVLATAIDGNLGLLGADYLGYFPVGDHRALAHLMRRAERDRRFWIALGHQVRRLQPRFAPARESEQWIELLVELFGPAVR